MLSDFEKTGGFEPLMLDLVLESAVTLSQSAVPIVAFTAQNIINTPENFLQKEDVENALTFLASQKPALLIEYPAFTNSYSINHLTQKFLEKGGFNGMAEKIKNEEVQRLNDLELNRDALAKSIKAGEAAVESAKYSRQSAKHAKYSWIVTIAVGIIAAVITVYFGITNNNLENRINTLEQKQPQQQAPQPIIIYRDTVIEEKNGSLIN